MRDSVYLQILGPLRVTAGGAEVDPGPHQQRSLLAFLLAQAGQPISMGGLLELLWGPDSPPSAVNVIHKYVGLLRRLLEPGLPPRSPGAYLVRHGDGYRFAAGPETLDLVLFRRLVTQARQAGAAEALELYAEALHLGHGAAGDGLAATPAAQATFAGLDGEFFDAVVAAAGLAVHLRQPGRLLAPLRRAAGMDPLNEVVQAALVTTLAAAGHRAEALTTHRSAGERLASELGIAPGPELQEARRRVLIEAVLPPVRPAQLPPDLAVFAGRAAELERLTELLGNSPVIALDGAPGTGKSTLAVHFAHRVAREFTDGQLYLDLRLAQTPAEALRSLLYGLGVRTPDLPGTFDAQVGTYRSLTAGKRVLVLLDNVRDAAQVRALLPSSPASLVLVTSRSPLVELAALDGAHLLHIDVPDRATARDLLQRRLTGLSPLHLDKILARYGRLPLSLATAAARLTAHPQDLL